MDPKEEALKRKKELEDANQKFDPEKKEALKRKKELEDANKKLNTGRPSTTPKKNLLPAQLNLKPKFVQNVKIEFHYNYIEKIKDTLMV